VEKLEGDGYVMGGYVGRGVTLAEKCGESFAVKWTQDCDVLARGQLQAEYDMLQKICHPNIVKATGLFIAPNSEHAMVMELVPGTTLMKSMPTLSTEEAHEILTKTMSALAYLHENMIAYRDLKADNIMVNTHSARNETDEAILVKLIDFGSARLQDLDELALEFPASPFKRQVSDSEVSGRGRLNSAVSGRGRLDSAVSMQSSLHDGIMPEILPPTCRGRPNTPFELDVFALGLIVIGVLRKKATFTRDVFAGCALKLVVPHISETAKEYVHAMLDTDPEARPRMEDACWGLPSAISWFTEDMEATE